MESYSEQLTYRCQETRCVILVARLMLLLEGKEGFAYAVIETSTENELKLMPCSILKVNNVYITVCTVYFFNKYYLITIHCFKNDYLFKKTR